MTPLPTTLTLAIDAFIAIAAPIFVALLQIGWQREKRHYHWLAAAIILMIVRWSVAPLDEPILTGVDAVWVTYASAGALGLWALWAGLLGHFGVPVDARRRVLLAVAGALAATFAGAWFTLTSGQFLSRAWVVAWGYAQLLILTGFAAWAWRRESGVGHGMVALACLMLPLGNAAAWALDHQTAILLFWTMGPACLLPLLVIRTNYLREQRNLAREVAARQAFEGELVAANERLEQRVAERTREIRDALQKAEAAHESRGRFLALISHEIRTPLNGLSGMLQILGSTPLSRDQQDLLKTSRASLRELRSLLDDLLDLAKMEAGRFQIEVVPFDIREQLVECIEPFRRLASERGLGFSMSLHTPQRRLQADPNRVAQIVRNLLDNALKFTPTGGISVDVTSAWVDPQRGGCELRIVVSDTGVGIAPEQQALIFQSFKQADSSVARRFGGTGLGLALCRELCHHMGGEISVDSEPGRGSRFAVVLPCMLAPAETMPVSASTAPASPPEDSGALSGRRVLVVDDNRVNQKVMQRMLESAGLSVEVASSGEAALDRVAVEPFDLVLMDISMPGMDGLTATRAIRALGESGPASRRGLLKLPVIGVSAMAMQGDRESGIEVGMCDYLFKPIERHLLIATVARALHSR